MSLNGPYIFPSNQVDPTLLQSARNIFDNSSVSDVRTFASDFGARRLEQDMRILDLPEKKLLPAWEACVQNAVRANIAVEDELMKAADAHVCTFLLFTHATSNELCICRRII